MASFDESFIKVSDVTQCSICLETFKEPKALPCIHTFCLQCLDRHCEGKKQGEIACPLCRKVFTTPPGGNINLPSNFFILQLLQVNQSTGIVDNKEYCKQSLCELCSDSAAPIPSTSYCIECDQHICDRCSTTHRKAKVSKSHQVVPEAEIPSREERTKLTVSYCDQHPTEQIRLYCEDCNIVTCHFCFADKHNGHKLMDVNKSAEKLRLQLKDDVDNVSASASKKLESIKQLEIETSQFMEKIAATESEISRKYDELLSLIESHKSQLMEELNAFNEKILKDIQTEKDKIEREFVIMESFRRYSLEIMEKGTACDISRTANDLHARSKEIVKTKDETDFHGFSGIEITFKPSLLTTGIAKNLIGELVFRGYTKDTQKFYLSKFLASPTVLHVMPSTGQPITGIAVIGANVFLSRFTSVVNVYKSDDFALVRNLSITGSQKLEGLISCSHFNCLYACDSGQKIIYRYDVTNNSTANWSVTGACYRLSVTKCYNLLATLNDYDKRILEYTTHGCLIREISFDRGIDSPSHSVQLSTGNYVVCHEGKHAYRVCIVDQSGRIIQSYGGSRGSGIGQFNRPLHLAVDAHDNVLVADKDNNRVQLLSPTLTHLGNIVIPGYQWNRPCTLYFDELNCRLFIGEWDGKRMFVIG